jgi:hypothetical protein
MHEARVKGGGVLHMFMQLASPGHHQSVLNGRAGDDITLVPLDCFSTTSHRNCSSTSLQWPTIALRSRKQKLTPTISLLSLNHHQAPSSNLA